MPTDKKSASPRLTGVQIVQLVAAAKILKDADVDFAVLDFPIHSIPELLDYLQAPEEWIAQRVREEREWITL